MNQLEQSIAAIVNTKEYSISNADSKLALTKAMLSEEQAFNSIVHRFGGGLYIREAHYSKNTLIVGQEHLSEHMNVLLKGSICVVDGDGQMVTLTAPHMFVAKAGSKVGYTLEDVVWQNIYVTSSTDVEYLESTLFKVPSIVKEHQEQKLLAEYSKHEEDRKDFLLVLEESGWTLENVELVSKDRSDCIPFPEGSYSITTSNSPIQGKGIFSTAEIKQGTVIAPMQLRGYRTPAGYSTNHSKDANCYAIKNEFGDMFLVANRDIHGMVGGDFGEELTLNYRQVMQINNLWKRTTICQQHP